MPEKRMKREDCCVQKNERKKRSTIYVLHRFRPILSSFILYIKFMFYHQDFIFSLDYHSRLKLEYSAILFSYLSNNAVINASMLINIYRGINFARNMGKIINGKKFIQFSTETVIHRPF